MDFSLSREHETARGMFSQFALREAAPIARDVDEYHRFPRETVIKMARCGMMGIPFAREFDQSMLLLSLQLRILLALSFLSLFRRFGFSLFVSPFSVFGRTNNTRQSKQYPVENASFLMFLKEFNRFPTYYILPFNICSIMSSL